MADEAFALSPISARAAQPSEADYDAIQEAFMETSRGRWFLGEYAKRNRNADTRMVLDAVARIEENLSTQKQPPPKSELPEALIAIRTAVEEARAAMAVALGDLAIEENLTPVRKGARVIREISWRLREIGADGRICDLIDSQVGAIEGACGKIAASDTKAALSTAFNVLDERIAAFDERDASVPSAEAAATPSEVTEEMSAAGFVVEETHPSPDVYEEAPPAAAAQTVVDDAVVDTPTTVPDEAATPSAELVEMAAETMEIMADDLLIDARVAAEEIDAAANAEDEAVLEMIALEMAAPDPTEAYDPPENEAYEIEAAELARQDALTVSEKPASIAAPAIQPSLEPPAQPSDERSLGSSLIANGIVRRPRPSGPDPLAPIRRMSQVEKIAFFS
jgi:hypothetical protein